MVGVIAMIPNLCAYVGSEKIEEGRKIRVGMCSERFEQLLLRQETEKDESFGLILNSPQGEYNVVVHTEKQDYKTSREEIGLFTSYEIVLDENRLQDV